MRHFLLVLLSIFFCGGLLHAKDLRGDTIDIRSYQLRLDLSDFTGKIMRGDATIGIKAKMNGVEGIKLDLLGLTVDSVKVDGYNPPFDYNDSVLNINLLNTFNTGDSSTIRIYYHGHPLQVNGDFGGFYWTGTYAFNIGVSFLADPHTYGRVWFPCFDNFEQRSYYEYFVTTKSNHKAFCNGLLQGVTPSGANQVWHWKLGQPIQSYLASVAVAPYATLEDTVQGQLGTLPVELAAIPTDTTALKSLFVHLNDAFHIQENAWGPYRWDRVGYCIVPFNAGAMEHATNISFMQYYLNVLASDCETTMAHELSHHWFGDLVTCDSAGEMWLNEGWATYNEHLFEEKFYGPDVYAQYVRANHDDIVHTAHIDDNGYRAVNGVPSEYTYGTTVYRKGADMIHTLRWYMGDAQFFNCLKNYMNDFAFKNSTTAQLRDYLVSCSGNNKLNDYFANWINAPGFTHFSIEQLVPQGSGQIDEHVYIRQRLSHAPNLYTNVPVKVTCFNNDFTSVSSTAIVSGECSEAVVGPLNFTPVYVAVDFDDNLQDAVSAEWQIISTTGQKDFGTARAKLQVNSITDSVLVRIEHNWIAPDAMKNPVQGLHLHDYRYWTIDGIINAGFDANATFNYDGSAGAYLDNTFFTNNEDSLVMLWRAKQTDDWSVVDSFTIAKGISGIDKVGSITVYNVQKGEYAMAIWNSALPTATDNRVSCFYQVGVNELSAESFEVYPNPSSDFTKLRFAANTFTGLELHDILGRVLISQKVSPEQTNAVLDIQRLPAGAYMVTLTGEKRSSKTIIKQ